MRHLENKMANRKGGITMVRSLLVTVVGFQAIRWYAWVVTILATFHYFGMLGAVLAGIVANRFFRPPSTVRGKRTLWQMTKIIMRWAIRFARAAKVVLVAEFNEVGLDWLHEKLAVLTTVAVMIFGSLTYLGVGIWWRWMFVIISFTIVQVAIWHYRHQFELLTTLEQKGKSFAWGVAKVVIGGKIGVVAWVVAFAAIASGGYFWGETGAWIGLGVAKITYIPWVYGVIRQGCQTIKSPPVS